MFFTFASLMAYQSACRFNSGRFGIAEAQFTIKALLNIAL